MNAWHGWVGFAQWELKMFSIQNTASEFTLESYTNIGLPCLIFDTDGQTLDLEFQHFSLQQQHGVAQCNTNQCWKNKRLLLLSTNFHTHVYLYNEQSCRKKMMPMILFIHGFAKTKWSRDAGNDFKSGCWWRNSKITYVTHLESWCVT